MDLFPERVTEAVWTGANFFRTAYKRVVNGIPCKNGKSLAYVFPCKVTYNNEGKFNFSQDFLSSLWNARFTFGPSVQCSTSLLGIGLLLPLHSVFYCGLWTRTWDIGTPLWNFHLTNNAHTCAGACCATLHLMTRQITVHGLVIASHRMIVSWQNVGKVQMLWHGWILNHSLKNLPQFHCHWTVSWIGHFLQHLNFQRSGSKHIWKPIKSLHQRLFWTTCINRAKTELPYLLQCLLISR